MLIKLFCYLWGHKFIVKAFTGKTFKTYHPLVNEQIDGHYWKYEQIAFCSRCGIKNPYFEQWFKEMIERNK